MKSKILLFCLLSSITVFAQNPPVPVSFEKLTFDNTAAGIGFTASTLTVIGQQVRTCYGTLETAEIRYRIDGIAAPTAAEGMLLSIGQVIQIDGYTALTRLRGIRTGAVSGIIRFTCAR